jgi:hypothetical protein
MSQGQEEPSDLEKYIMMGYYIFVFLSSLIGDPIILIASIKYKAFKLHKFIITLIQHIAVCDLVVLIICVPPRIANIITKHFIAESKACMGARMYILTYIYSVSMYLVSALTLSKLLIFKFPLPAKKWKKKQGNIVCAVIWIMCLIAPLLIFLVEKNKFKMDDTVFDSEIDDEIKLPLSYFLISTGLNIVVPCLIAILTTVPTLIILIQGMKNSKRSRGKVRWQGIVTVVLTALVFCVSYLPLPAYLYYRYFSEEKPSIHLKKVVFSLPMLNIISNFYIYSLTVPSFRQFLSSKMKQTCNCCSEISQVQDVELQQRDAQRPFPGVTTV